MLLMRRNSRGKRSNPCAEADGRAERSCSKISGHRRQTARRVRRQLQVNQRGLDAGVSQPPAEVIQRDTVQQQVTGVAVPERVSADTPAGVQLAGVRGPPRRLLYPPPGRSPGNADQGAASHRAVTGGRDEGRLKFGMHRNRLVRLPLPLRTLRVGRSVFRRRSRVSSARASDIRSPARHCTRIKSLAWGLGAAAISAPTSWASRYSGSVKPLAPGLCCSAAPLVFTPRGRRLRGRVVVMPRSVTNTEFCCTAATAVPGGCLRHGRAW